MHSLALDRILPYIPSTRAEVGGAPVLTTLRDAYADEPAGIVCVTPAILCAAFGEGRVSLFAADHAGVLACASCRWARVVRARVCRRR